MRIVLSLLACVMLVGCSPPAPISKEQHIKQVLDSVVKAGGETNILKESRTLFLRLSKETNPPPFYTTDDKCFEGLSGITNLGDVYYYQAYEPDHIEVRIHNSHFDTYFIHLF